MSSPIHHAKDLDAALTFAPPWARDQARPMPVPPAAAPIELQRSRRGNASCVFSGDRAALELQRQLALDPDCIPEPPSSGVQALRPIALRLCAVAGAAALVAGAMVSVPGARLIGNDTVRAGFSSLAITVNRGKQDQLPDAAAAPLPIPDGQAEASQPPPARIAHLENPVLAPPIAAAPPVPAVTPAAATQSTSPASDSSSNLQLDGDEVATLIKRGEDFLTNGDFASARLLLRRAAAAGSAKAALALGATFDPLIIQRLGAIGAQPDPDRARKWYQKAAELGSDAASQQLEKLAQAHQ